MVLTQAAESQVQVQALTSPLIDWLVVGTAAGAHRKVAKGVGLDVGQREEHE